MPIPVHYYVHMYTELLQCSSDKSSHEAFLNFLSFALAYLALPYFVQLRNEFDFVKKIF